VIDADTINATLGHASESDQAQVMVVEVTYRDVAADPLLALGLVHVTVTETVVPPFAAGADVITGGFASAPGTDALNWASQAV